MPLPTMGRWKYTLDVTETWSHGPAGTDEMEAEDFGRTILGELRAFRECMIRVLDEYEIEQLGELLEDLEMQLDSDFTFDDFDDWWSCFYDWADANRVWVETR